MPIHIVYAYTCIRAKAERNISSLVAARLSAYQASAYFVCIKGRGVLELINPLRVIASHEKAPSEFSRAHIMRCDRERVPNSQAKFNYEDDILFFFFIECSSVFKPTYSLKNFVINIQAIS